MKIRSDFVTNSSSSSFILVGKGVTDIKDALKHVNKDNYLVGIIDGAISFGEGNTCHILVQDSKFAKLVRKNLDKLDGWITWFCPILFQIREGDEIGLQEILDRIAEKNAPTEGMRITYGECTINTITTEDDLNYLLEAMERNENQN